MAAACFLPLAWSRRSLLRAQPRSFWLAAAELALWNFAAQGLLNAALLHGGATRVSFIAQASMVLTPLLAASRGQRVPPLTWLSCVVALSGVALLATDGGGAAAAAARGARLARVGDVLALCGAAASSFYTFRIGELSRRGLSTDMTQAVKAVLLACLYCVWAAFDGARIVAAGGALTALWPGWRSRLAWAVLLYSAVVPGAAADVLQARGQAKVAASEAQVLLGAQPLWTALFGAVLLNERLGPAGAAGAGLIVAAVLLVAGSGRLESLWRSYRISRLKKT